MGFSWAMLVYQRVPTIAMFFQGLTFSKAHHFGALQPFVFGGFSLQFFLTWQWWRIDHVFDGIDPPKPGRSSTMVSLPEGIHVLFDFGMRIIFSMTWVVRVPRMQSSPPGLFCF